MGLDDLGKQAVNAYKKLFMSFANKTDVYINDAIESMGDPFKYNGLTNNSRKFSINNLTDYLNDIQEYKEKSIKRINSAFEKAQKVDGDMIDEIRPLYQQALDQINTSMENVSIYEQQLVGLKNAEKYKEGTKAFNRGFNNVRGEELVKQEIEIEDIWDKGKKEQQKLYDDINKHYTQTYHPEIDTHGYYFSEETSSFLNDDALKQYEDLKQMAPGIIITEQSYNWETDIDKAHESALRENKQVDSRQAEEKARRRVNNNTNNNTAQNQVNNSTTAHSQVNNSTTAQNQVNREPKKRRKSYADRTTKPINSKFNNSFYGQYDIQTGTYEYPDYKSHYSGGVSRSNYDEEWIDEKLFGEAHSNSEYGIEAPWSTNRAQTDIPTSPPESVVNVANNMPTPIDNLNKLLNKTRPEQRMWTNRDFVFGDNYINNKDFNRTVTEFYTNTENAERLFEKIAKFSDLEYSPNDFKIYENMFDTYKRATGQTTKNVQQQIIDQFKEWKVSPEETQRHFRLIKEAAEEVGWQGSYEHLDYSSFKIDDVIETRKKPKLKNADKSYRPEVTMNGNNVEIDSIYNHSIPKRVNKNNVPEPETTVPEPETTTPEPETTVPEPEPETTVPEPEPETTVPEPETTVPQPEPETTTTLSVEEQAEQLNKKQMYEDILDDWKKTSSDFSSSLDNRNLKKPDKLINNGSKPHNIYAEAGKHTGTGSYIEGARTGSYIANAKYVDDAGNLVKTRKVTKTFGPNPLEDVSKVGVLTTGLNILGTISDYKDERRKGHGVVSSAARAGAKFAMYEALGLWSIPVALVSNAPGAIIKGADMLYKENRKMNSAANFEAFGGAQFMDTQQLATMRQSGMEMAKMANYNLQQTLMGNEATYLHR